MFVSERDIFDYVFYPNCLNESLSVYIGNNEDIFSSEIESYKTSKLYSKNKVEFEDKIVNKLMGNSMSRIIDFLKLETKQRQGAKVFLLDSSTPRLEKSIVTETFVDEDSQYLVKVVIANNFTKIYVFNKNNTLLENFKLTIFPENKSYRFENNQNPLVLEGERSVEDVKLEIID
ncbi:MAG: hypothetical protein JEY94_00680 [Melioribacteraceae bacterium]|nr:hypothetical protein [Melioribacteraceae bacterium]